LYLGTAVGVAGIFTADRPTIDQAKASAFRSDDPEPNSNHTDNPDCESKTRRKENL
jgi:hypothetical protein